MAGKPRDPFDRFFTKFKVSDGCWNWTASTFTSGYGQFYDGKNKICAHRFIYEYTYGKLPKDLLVCHKCDNKLCVRPSHLFAGTYQDNHNDMIKKGRKVNADTSGSKNGRAVLTEDLVKEIRLRYNTESISIIKIAKLYGISETQMHRVLKNDSWKNV